MLLLLLLVIAVVLITMADLWLQVAYLAFVGALFASLVGLIYLFGR